MLAHVAYVLLRREFLSVRPGAGSASPVKRLLVTLGGSDSRNRTALILGGLDLLPEAVRRCIDVQVVLGPGSRHHDAIEG